MFPFLQKHGFLIVGSGFIILGLFTLLDFFQDDLSKNTGIGFLIIGVLFIVYYFFKKRTHKN